MLCNLSSAYKIHTGPMRNDAPLIAHFKQFANRFLAIFAIVQRTFVDVHSYKSVGKSSIQIARKLHRVSQRLLTMVQSMLDAVAKSICRSQHSIVSKRAPDGIAAQG